MDASQIVEQTAPGHFKVGLCQFAGGEDKESNIKNAREAIEEAVRQSAQLVVLPECWNSPYSPTAFPKYAEPIPFEDTQTSAPDKQASPSIAMMCELAEAKSIYLVGGSVPEKDSQGKVYNTCVVVGPDGFIIARHRKMHLFDIDVPGKITFRESETLSAGDEVTTFATVWGTMGVGICYDLRFPHLAMAMRARGCKVLFYPGAFNLTTGPLHWELLQRTRAVDTQCFVITVAPARSPGADYQSWGHSTVVDPWGKILKTTEEHATTFTQDIDLRLCDEVRKNIPVWPQQRRDIYQLVVQENGTPTVEPAGRL